MKATIINIEIAFIHGNRNEDMYMHVLLGLNVEPDKRSILSKTIDCSTSES
jgi:hypothetical protein